MNRYDIRKLAPRPKGTTLLLGQIHARPMTERAYERALFGMLAELAKVVRDEALPAYKPANFVGDADERFFERFKILASFLSRNVTATVSRILNLEKERHTAEFMKTAKKTLGIDLTAVVRNADLDAYMTAAVQRNSNLITSLGEQVVSRVEQTILKNTMEGNSARTLRDELQKQFDISKSRATLIAEDQVSKFNADLNEIRQRQAEIDEYDWSTSDDQRVRPLHRKLDGKTYRWGQPTGAEEGRPPGQPIRCRCIAMARLRY